jgi:nitronate monooxygenase
MQEHLQMSINMPLNDLLRIQYPILLAAMDVVADAKLTRAVSAAGGFGILGAGYGNAGWLRRELALLLDTRDSQPLPFGIGFITWSLANQPHLLDQALVAKPAAIWLSFGDPAPFVEKIKKANALVVCQVQSEAMAQDAVMKGADIIVAQGSEAGGHGVSRSSMTLVPAVVDAVGHQVPVVMAGGVADGRGLAAALMLGAQGVVLGTRFYACQEAAGHPDAKARIVAASGDDTMRSIVFDVSRNNVWPAPYTGRCLINDHSRKWAGREMELMRHRHEEGERYLAARSNGDFNTAAVIAGEAVGLIRDVPTAKEIIQRIMADANQLLDGASRIGSLRSSATHSSDAKSISIGA